MERVWVATEEVFSGIRGLTDVGVLKSEASVEGGVLKLEAAVKGGVLKLEAEAEGGLCSVLRGILSD